MLLKCLILLSLKLLVISAQQSSPRCSFAIQNGTYVCNLQIQNNDTEADFSVIEGDHLEGSNDSSVQLLRASQQTTFNIPSIICRQFSNIKELIVILSQVQVITQSSFAGCSVLETLKIYYNTITDIPPYTFINNPLLSFVDIASNRITRLEPGVFRGTSVKSLSIDENQLTTFDGSWLTDVSESLTILNLRKNLITALPSQAFVQLRNLEFLDLDSNQLSDIPPDAFEGLHSLQDLVFYSNRLTSLRPEWFITLGSLQRLRLEYNAIEELPTGIFSSNNQLQMLWMSNNNIKVIDSNSFGDLQNLDGFYFEFNLIEAIDERFYDRAVNLFNLYLYSNNCTSGFFTGVNNTRAAVRNALRPCFDNFVPANNGSISCEYDVNEDIGYTCTMLIDNPLGIEFQVIPGDHVPSFGDDNVTMVQSYLQRTSIVPSILCRQFVNLQFIYIAMCRVEELSREAFENCLNLEYLSLDFNDVQAISDNTFSSSPRLNTLSFFVNKITEIGPNAFTGTALTYLNLGNNQISSINPVWFEDGRGDLLRYLLLDSNDIKELPSNVFSTLRNLTELIVTSNPLEDIASDAFAGLENLEILNLGGCQLKSLNPQWFNDLTNLQRLYIVQNELTDLPVGIVNNVTHLNVANNQLQAINANSFRNVNNLVVLNAQTNQINEVDPNLYDAESLYTLQLLNNECASINIVNLPLNREFYRDRFELCFENFMLENFGFIECQYTQVEVIGYHCIMSIYNVRGNDNYEEIEGEHLENFGNSDVVYIEAYQQQTTIIPSIICRQFVNLQMIYFGFNGVEELFAGNFDECRNLKDLNIEANNIEILPDLMLHNSAHLHTFTADNNQISQIAENALTGTSLLILRLESNLLTIFNANWFNGINETLQMLTIRNNSITSLPENAFENLRNLQELEIGFNDLPDMPANIFQGLSNLLFLSLSNCNIRDLKAAWFNDLTSLGSLFLNYNHLTSIPDGIFSNQLGMYELNFNGNRLSSLNSEAYGNLSSILYISAMNNRINLIDPKLYDESANLYNLFLFNNLCVDDNFISIINNREDTREHLRACFENHENDGFMECNYVNDAAYTCELTVQNVLGRANPDRIGGQHVDNLGDSNVLFVEALLQHTASFPSIICRQFRNLLYIYILESKLQELTQEVFESCTNLNALILDQNEIRVVPDNVFSSSPTLSLLSFLSNEVNLIQPDAFAGTSLTYVNLNGNHLTKIDPGWFEGSRGNNLMYFMLDSNNIQTLSSNAFPNLPKIIEISLSYNQLKDIASDAFAGLSNLQILELNSCGLKTLQHQWFSDLSGLLRIYLNQNKLTELPVAIFGNLTHVYVASNQLQRIDANSFSNLSNLILFNGRNNQINEIDPVFFNDTQSMYNLQLNGNICVSIDVMNLALNREYYRPLFEQCFSNFEGTY
ncbi:hypothetical protein ACKWTF_015477 [Chironomus riparius]